VLLDVGVSANADKHVLALIQMCMYMYMYIHRLDPKTMHMGSMGFRNPRALGCGAQHSEGAVY